MCTLIVIDVVIHDVIRDVIHDVIRDVIHVVIHVVKKRRYNRNSIGFFLSLFMLSIVSFFH